MNREFINQLNKKFKKVTYYPRDKIPYNHKNHITKKGDGILVIKNNGNTGIFELSNKETEENILEVINQCFE